MKKEEFKIKKIGNLKYSRLKSLSILRRELNSFGYKYTMTEVKELLDSILNNRLNKSFGLKMKSSIEEIFYDMEYLENNNYPTEKNFPDNWIAPEC